MKEGTWHCKYVLRYHNKTLGDPLLKGVLSLHTFPLTVTPSGPRKCHRKQGVTLSGVTVSGEVCICKTHRIFAWAPSRSFPFKAQTKHATCLQNEKGKKYVPILPILRRGDEYDIVEGSEPRNVPEIREQIQNSPDSHLKPM